MKLTDVHYVPFDVSRFPSEIGGTKDVKCPDPDHQVSSHPDTEDYEHPEHEYDKYSKHHGGYWGGYG